MNEETTTTGSTVPSQGTTWRCGCLVIAWLIVVGVHAVYMPLLCDSAGAKILLATGLYGFLLLRIAYARISRERGAGWRWYLWFIITAPIWFEAIWYVIVDSKS
jgi:hypothetical protein